MVESLPQLPDQQSVFPRMVRPPESKAAQGMDTAQAVVLVAAGTAVVDVGGTA